jgi:hypothetical protein
MTNQVNEDDSVEFLYARAVLTKIFLSGIITSKVYEAATKKARLRFNKNSCAV